MNTSFGSGHINTCDASAVSRAVIALGRDVYGAPFNGSQVQQIFRDVARMFKGGFIHFQPMDTGYHNLEHTLQTTLCWARLLRNHQRYAGKPRVTEDAFHAGLAAALLHDVGYLKEENDGRGSGAKFTYVHERRSCELAQIYLSQRSWSPGDIAAVQHMISCTGPQAAIDKLPFRNSAEKLLGQMLCTADYLGQMSDPGYIDKLPSLFKEFEECDSYRGIPADQRYFQSATELLRRTPAFWANQVLPRLNQACDGLYHYLADPYPNGRNPYLEAIQHNMELLEAQPECNQKADLQAR